MCAATEESFHVRSFLALLVDVINVFDGASYVTADRTVRSNGRNFSEAFPRSTDRRLSNAHRRSPFLHANTQIIRPSINVGGL